MLSYTLHYDYMIFFLALCVVFVNGWTDAPSSVASCVSTGAVSLKKSLVICAVFNFLGVLLVSFVNLSVAENILDSARFGVGISKISCCCACFVSVCLFGIIAWLFALPSSESHALVSAIGGASLYVNSSTACLDKIGKISTFMFISCIISFILSFAMAKVLPKKGRYEKFEVGACIGTSFMHGAQDGQKFIGIILSLSALPFSTKNGNTIFSILCVSFVMGIGTLTGGKRIIKSLGERMVFLDARRGFISDISSGMCLLFCSVFGLPVSTGNIKSCSLAGAGLGDGCKINGKTFLSFIMISVITFPVCFLFGYAFTGIFMRII